MKLKEKEEELLKWLGQEEQSLFGSCYGSTLNKLVLLGLVYIVGTTGQARVTLTAEGGKYLMLMDSERT